MKNKLIAVTGEDVLKLFSDLDPIQITLIKPTDSLQLLYVMLEKMTGSFEKAQEFLALVTDASKEIGVENAVNQAIETYNDTFNDDTPQFVSPLLKALISHSTDPVRSEKFHAYLKSKKEKGAE